MNNGGKAEKENTPSEANLQEEEVAVARAGGGARPGAGAPWPRLGASPGRGFWGCPRTLRCVTCRTLRRHPPSRMLGFVCPGF